MAAATLISPTTPYHSHHPPSFAPSYHSGPVSTAPGMISPVESRRTSDDSEPAHRQSLPSIQEVIGQKSASSYPLPPQATTVSAAQSLPSPFSASAPTRLYSDAGGEKHPSPRTLLPTASSSLSRGETLPAFAEPPRPHLRPVASAPFSGSGPLKLDYLQQQQQQREAEQRLSEGQQHNGSYQYPAPPGHLPLSAAYPISPRHVPPALPSPFDPRAPPLLHPDDPDFGRQQNNKYEATLTRHLEEWNYSETLARVADHQDRDTQRTPEANLFQKIATAARTVYNFADAYDRLMKEEHSNQPIPTRMPSEREIADMINNAEWLKTMLDNVRTIVQQSNIHERARENSRPKTAYDGEDVAMYGDGMKLPLYGGHGNSHHGSSHGSVSHASIVAEVKKRRGVSKNVQGGAPCFFGFSYSRTTPANLISSAQPHRGGVIAATGWTRPNGAGVRTAHAHCAMPAACITPN